MLRQKQGDNPLQPRLQLQRRKFLILHRQGNQGGHGAKTKEITDHRRRLQEQAVTLFIERHNTDHPMTECVNGFNQGRLTGNHLLPTTVSTLCLSYPSYARSVGFPAQG